MNYEITEEQIKELAKGNAKVKKWFPEVFETKLEIGRWYKGTYLNSNNDLLFISNLDEKRNLKGFGVSYAGNWFDCRKKTLHYGNIEESNDWTPATDTEVLEALTNEAKKKYKIGDYVNPPSKIWSRKIKLYLAKDEKEFTYRNNELLFCGVQIYSNGKWAEIVKTYTKEEAEKMLNAKII